MKTQKQNLNELKEKIFKDLADRVKTISANQETITFMRRTNFGVTRVYFEYNIKEGKFNQMYVGSPKNKKIIYEGK